MDVISNYNDSFLDRIPIDILQYISSFLDVRTSRHFRLVCRKFCAVMTNNLTEKSFEKEHTKLGALFISSLFGHISTTSILFMFNKFDINENFYYDILTFTNLKYVISFPLYIASKTGRVELVNFLLTHGANVNQTNGNGETSLQWASQRGHVEVVNLLLNHGANVNQANVNDIGETPLYIASFHNNVKIVSLLLNHKANINQADNDGKTALYIASLTGHVEVVSLLLNHGAIVNQATNDGITPLHIASQNGHVEVVSLLLNNGANINQARNDGCTPLYIASQTRNNDLLVALLINHGAK